MSIQIRKHFSYTMSSQAHDAHFTCHLCKVISYKAQLAEKSLRRVCMPTPSPRLANAVDQSQPRVIWSGALCEIRKYSRAG